MLKTLLILFVFSVSSFSFPKTDEGDYIPWQANRKLKWDDFKATAPGNTDDAALTTTYVGFSYSKKNNKIDFDIECKFQKNTSWGRVKTDYILKHEQGHFDIAEITARRLNRELKEYLSKNSNHLELNTIYSKWMQEKQTMQNLYDAETRHSILKEKQQEWDKKIDSLLNASAAYSDY